MAEAAVNFVPSRDGASSRTIGCNQQQGVLVLSAAFRLVAHADIASQGTRRGIGQGGLYAQWFTNCFGPQGECGASRGVEQAEVRPASPGFGQEKRVPEPHGAGPQLSGSEVCENRWFCGPQEDSRETAVLGAVLWLKGSENECMGLWSQHRIWQQVVTRVSDTPVTRFRTVIDPILRFSPCSCFVGSMGSTLHRRIASQGCNKK